MPKGFYTQTTVVLLRENTPIEDVVKCIADYSPSEPKPAQEHWSMCGPSATVLFNEEQNGRIVVDVVDHPWPDEMGDPETDAAVFGAWATGQFGPFTFPGSLVRATEQSWAWEGGRTEPLEHTAFIRVRSSYVMGSGDDAPLTPEDYDSYEDLVFATEIAAKLAELPQAICYFNPNGEVLRNLEGLNESIEIANDEDLPPHDLWSNVRLFKVDDEWSIMDTVGNDQLELPDCEAIFHAESYDLEEMDNFLRNCILYMLDEGDVLEDGDTSEGPGEIQWRAQRFEAALTDPPRAVVRWTPLDDRPLPAVLGEQSDESLTDGPVDEAT